MDGIATFLLGSALGAVLGYLASRRKPHKTMITMPGSRLETPPVVPPTVAEEPAFQPGPSPEAVFSATSVPEAPEVEAPEAEGADVLAPTVEAPEAEAPAAEIPETEPDVLETPELEAVVTVEAPPFEAVIGEEMDKDALDRTVTVAEAPEPELVATEAPVEETLPDWVAGPAAATAIEEEAVGGTPPVIAEEPAFWEPEGAGPESVAVAEEVPAPSEPDVAEIEFIDMTAFEVSIVEAADLETAEQVEAAVAEQVEAPAVERVDLEAPEPAVAESEGVVETQPTPVISPMDDLKARIEETRRRIRRELEHPFLSADEIAEADDWTISPAVPVLEEAAPGTVDAGPVSPEPLGAEPFETEPADLLADAMAFDSASETVAEEAADYQSMKSRIEVTRSRLKAKAFDAMMSGESALLGRDPENAQAKRPVAPAIDSEIDQTIETSLREQET